MHQDDGSHYEVSLTGGQAFVAFVLLLFSLAAAFAFGVLVGNGQFQDSAAVAAAAETPQRTATAQQAKIVELGEPALSDRDPQPPPNYQPPVIVEEPSAQAPTASAAEAPVTEPAPRQAVPHFAQILSTTDADAAEALARKLIDGGFPAAYVERSASPRGTVHRVRVRFASEQAARQDVSRLKAFTTGEIWVAPVR